MDTSMTSSKPKALIVIPQAAVLPLTEPAVHPGVSTGFYLVEMAQVLKEFGDDYEFTFATPADSFRNSRSTVWACRCTLVSSPAPR